MQRATTPLCPACGCSLARLGIGRQDATAYSHEGGELLFCCQGCVEVFTHDPESYLAQIRDWIVCPSCLAEKPKPTTVSLEHEGERVYLCRCPHCRDAFEREPHKPLARLAI